MTYKFFPSFTTLSMSFDNGSVSFLGTITAFANIPCEINTER